MLNIHVPKKRKGGTREQKQGANTPGNHHLKTCQPLSLSLNDMLAGFEKVTGGELLGRTHRHARRTYGERVDQKNSEKSFRVFE